MSNYKYWIALEQAKGIGPANLQIIYDKLNSFGLSVIDLFALTPAEIKAEFAFHEIILNAIENAKKSLYRIEEEYHLLLDSGVDPVLFFEEAYPDRFHEILKNQFPLSCICMAIKICLKKKARQYWQKRI